MPVDWAHYDALRLTRGLPVLGDGVREALESLAAGALGLLPEHWQQKWGRAEGYGLYSTAVIRTQYGMPHQYRCQRDLVAVKIYHRAAEKLVRFHREVLPHVWQPPMQRTLDAGITEDTFGKRRGFSVLEFIEGTPLDVVLASGSVSARTARKLLMAFFHECLIPIWARGLRFWDFRPANLIVTAGGMSMIDTDSLAAGAEEWYARGHEWGTRDRWEELAFQRLPGQITAVLEAVAHGPPARAAEIKRALESGLLEQLHQLGRGHGSVTHAMDAAQRIIETIAGT